MDVKTTYFVSTTLRHSDKEVRRLIVLARNGCGKSRLSILESFYGVVLKMVYKYTPTGIIEREDMLQVAMVAVHKSIEKFKLENKNYFCTYVYRAVSNDISRELVKVQGSIKIPAYIFDAQTLFLKQYFVIHKIKPTLRESIDYVKNNDIEAMIGKPINKEFLIKSLIVCSKGVMSLEYSLYKDAQDGSFNQTLASVLVAKDPPIVEQLIRKEELRDFQNLILENYKRSEFAIYSDYLFENAPNIIAYLSRKHKISRKNIKILIDSMNAYVKLSYESRGYMEMVNV